GLAQDTDYRVKVTTSDASGNVASASIDVLTIRPTPPPASPSPQPPQSPAPTPASPTPVPTISVGPNIPAGTEVQWNPPAAASPSGGYRVDVIGSDGRLVRTVHTTATNANVGDVPAGSRIIVYADNNGVYQKVAAPASIVTHPRSTAEQLLTWAPYLLGALVVLIGAAIAVLKLRKPKNTEPPVPAVPTSPTSGAMPNPSPF
ncbi:MAG TPA: hypothetical protein VMJ72_01005, partial [Candidatus Paceibacterota bacterium]|nr:hypothetical protein [Candidatus Paceibacterota bacterium]